MKWGEIINELYIFNEFDNLICIASNISQDSLTFWDAEFEEILNNASLFEFKTILDHEWSRHITERNQVGFRDKDGDLRLFKITSTEIKIGSSDEYIQVICSDILLELDMVADRNLIYSNQTLWQMLTDLLTRTRFQVGESIYLGGRSINIFNESRLEAFGQIINLFEVDFKVRVTMYQDRLATRYIDIKRRGEDTGLILNVGHNVESFTLETVTEHIRTSITPLGRAIRMTEEEYENEPDGYTPRTNIAGVYATVETHGFDKPFHAVDVVDEQAREIYGLPTDNGRIHLEEIVEFRNIEDEEELMIVGWEYLQTVNKPRYYIEINAIDLSELADGDFEHESIRVGDVVRLIDWRFARNIVIEARIISYKYDVINPDQSIVVLGNHRNLYSNDNRMDNLVRDFGNTAVRPMNFFDSVASDTLTELNEKLTVLLDENMELRNRIEKLESAK